MNYHDDTDRVSNSMLKVFADSPALYNALFVTKTMPRKESTPAMLLGSMVHCLWLEPELFDSRYVVAPKCDRRTNAGKEAWAKFVASSGDMEVVTDEAEQTARSIAESLARSEVAVSLRSCDGAIVETPIYWTDKETGLKLKAKPDLFIPAGATDWHLCVDLKTSMYPNRGFARQAADLGYHRQAAFYRSGCEATYDSDSPVKFLAVAVGTEEPHDVYLYYMGDDWITVGHEDNRVLLNRLAECYATGKWLHPAQSTITTLAMPRWLATGGSYV